VCRVALLVAALLVVPAAAQPATERLPDLDQVVPRQLRVRERDGRFLLGFAGAVDNLGRARWSSRAAANRANARCASGS
jgi:hypothetical protein